jgi:hypothetical protein
MVLPPKAVDQSVEFLRVEVMLATGARDIVMGVEAVSKAVQVFPPSGRRGCDRLVGTKRDARLVEEIGAIVLSPLARYSDEPATNSSEQPKASATRITRFSASADGSGV